MLMTTSVDCAGMAVRVHAHDHGISLESGLTVGIERELALRYARSTYLTGGEGFVCQDGAMVLAHRGVRIPLLLADTDRLRHFILSANEEHWKISMPL